MKCLATLAAALCLAGCGVSTTPTTTDPPSRNSSVTGNWQLMATSTQAPYVGTSATYGIFLTQTGKAVTGIIGMQQLYPLCVLPSGPPCAFPFGVIDLELVGTIDTEGNLALSSVPNSGAGGAFSITASANNNTLSGTFSITYAGPSGTYTDQGSISGYTVGSLNGTYTGTIKSTTTGNSIGVTTTLSQTAGPAPDGYLGVSGSASFAGSPCFSSATPPQPGSLLGNVILVGFVPASSPSTTIVLSGTLSQDARTIVATYLVSGSCGSDTEGGTLTLQQ